MPYSIPVGKPVNLSQLHYELEQLTGLTAIPMSGLNGAYVTMLEDTIPIEALLSALATHVANDAWQRPAAPRPSLLDRLLRRS